MENDPKNMIQKIIMFEKLTSKPGTITEINRIILSVPLQYIYIGYPRKKKGFFETIFRLLNCVIFVNRLKIILLGLRGSKIVH